MGTDAPEAATFDPLVTPAAEAGVAARPQPRPRPVAQDKGKGRRQRGKRRARKAKKTNYQGRMVNWVKVGAVALGLLLLTAAGGFIWLKVTPEGQLAMARMGRDANADALWTLGTEYLDQGYVARSVETYLKAEAKAPEHPKLAERLLLLAEAYEAQGRMDLAEKTYARIYSTLAPRDPRAWRLAIRILEDQNRVFEAVALMQKAYEATQDDAFFAQRALMVPLPPTASLPAGRHMYAKTVEFLSPQGYDIYYTTGDGPLPESGVKYREPLTLNEGTYTFRAVTVSSELISNEMAIRYTITLPSPLAPKANMASDTYERPIRVQLRNMDTDKDVQLYYTIDGTKPSQDSPRYTGEGILLPRGRAVLRAIAVNRYGKRSNEMVVEYKVNGTFKKYFRSDDGFGEFELLKTTADDFIRKFGEPASREAVEDSAVAGEARRLTYPWGEARFVTGEEGALLYHVATSLGSMTGPRGTRVGMQMKEVTDKFRDMGQVPNDRGDRGIYFDMAEGYARYTVHSDDPLSGLLRYVYVGGADGSTKVLDFDIEGGRVASITLRHMSTRMSLVE
ncbi:MAG TPA: chitobiase/beta-hexosaminidase C-terminal domain-containing protein [Candidatus Limnocylindria bacterium]|nr:chitobiase/beta-hexosaminidase C-terminal domain-containing protein [Candidatus Limnocylindria bacterium]